MKILTVGILASTLLACQDPTAVSELNESHPFQNRLECERASGSSLVGVLYDRSKGNRRKLGEYVQGHVGYCELAMRASREDKICLPKNSSFVAAKISTLETLRSFGPDFEACLSYTRGWDTLNTESGHLDFMDRDELHKVTKNLPQLSDQFANDALHSSKAIWYDESSMVFVYQDSFGNPKGLRANRVGYDVGSNNTIPDIRKLVEYFDFGKFKFPFSITAGADFHGNDHVLYFWLPPQRNGEVLPVRYWKNNSHFHWTFPVGTVFGEVLTLQAPDDKEWYTFEVRIRKRELSGWKTSIFRPFANSEAMSLAIQNERTDWQQTDLKNLVQHLNNRNSLQPHTLKTENYAKIIPDFKGAMDYLPATQDYDLLKKFLLNRIFLDVMQTNWKKSQSLQTFAASTKADFHIVPKDYIGGMFATTESACATCHNQTGRPVGDLDSRIVLYGEIWGEDQIFTWHPFEITKDAFTVSDGSRRINPRLERAGLVKLGKPTPNDQLYRPTDYPYKPIYE